MRFALAALTVAVMGVGLVLWQAADARTCTTRCYGNTCTTTCY